MPQSVNPRQKLKDLMEATLEDHNNWTYAFVRPLSVPSAWHKGQKVRADCSKAVQYLCRWAGVRDPMDNGYADWGNSQTLWLKLRHVSKPGQLEVGDVVTFGHDGEDHAAMVLEAGNDPLLWSFGHQGAPNTYRLSQDRREKQYLKLELPPIVTPEVSKLRARKGWFAWVAWRLGEGDWKHFGKSNKTVRPNVPRVIPPNWWHRYAKFLLRRKKPNAPSR